MSVIHIEVPHCLICGENMNAPGEDEPPICPNCTYKHPPSLLKATVDSFDYALGLRSGHTLRFTRAVIHGNYATLYRDDANFAQSEAGSFPYLCPRGVDVRIADIVWCADAPQGS